MQKNSFDQCLTRVDLSYSQACEALSELQHQSPSVGYQEAHLLCRQACQNLASLQERLQELCCWHE
jgi:hypothetical protein